MSCKLHEWEFVPPRLRGQHRIFRDKASGRLSLCDNSGANLDLTDDGPLWIDTSRPVEITRGQTYVPVPVHTESGKLYFVGACWQIAAAVVELVPNLRVNIGTEADHSVRDAMVVFLRRAAEIRAREANDELPCDGISCTCCNGPLVPLGTLGVRAHYRCRDCGLDQSREVEI